MKILILGSLLFWTALLHATEKHPHREKGAHKHGAAELSIAFDGPQGRLEFKSPSDSIVGFEHSAKSAKDLALRDDAFKKFETHISDMVFFEKSLQCQFKKEILEMRMESAKHSDTQATFSITCTTPPAGGKIVFNFQKYFPRLNNIDAQILLDKLQKSAEIKASGTVIELK